MPYKVLKEVLQRDNNSLDLVRTLSAMAVIFGHAFVLHPTGGWEEPVRKVFDYTYSGALAVDIFFFLSGILITSSFSQGGSIFRFCLMRVSRIWPGLLVCLLVSTLLVGPIVTSNSILDYLGSSEVRWYLFKNIQLQEITYSLPGVFSDNHYKDIVNGSLWTLPIEIRCYLMVLLLGALGGLRGSMWCTALAGGLSLLVLVGYTEPYKIFRVYGLVDTRLPLLFALGMLCYKNRAHIRVDWRVSAAALIVALAFKTELFGIAAFYLFVLNTALVVGAVRPVWFKFPGDYSYGLYIYGFVVQQCVAFYLPQTTAYSSLLLSLPISLGLAVISWHFIELPILGMARDFSKRHDAKTRTSVELKF